MGGLSVATFLTLGNLPALYVLLFRVKRPTDPLSTPTRVPNQTAAPGRPGAGEDDVEVSR
jgi:hypothetical protein